MWQTFCTCTLMMGSSGVHDKKAKVVHLHNALRIEPRQLSDPGVEDALPCAAQPHGGGNLAGHEPRDGDVCMGG